MRTRSETFLKNTISLEDLGKQMQCHPEDLKNVIIRVNRKAKRDLIPLYSSREPGKTPDFHTSRIPIHFADVIAAQPAMHASYILPAALDVEPEFNRARNAIELGEHERTIESIIESPAKASAADKKHLRSLIEEPAKKQASEVTAPSKPLSAEEAAKIRRLLPKPLASDDFVGHIGTIVGAKAQIDFIKQIREILESSPDEAVGRELAINYAKAVRTAYSNKPHGQAEKLHRIIVKALGEKKAVEAHNLLRLHINHPRLASIYLADHEENNGIQDLIDMLRGKN